jgi:DNA-binding transcriptional LysR family regulator
MELRQLRSLVNIIDHSGFAAAGEKSGITQSAISIQIKALEEELGEALFDRTKRPPRANAKAISLAKKARVILQLCNDLNNFSTNQLTGSLQLGAVPKIQTTLLPKAMKELQIAHPDLFIQVTTGFSDELTRCVRREILDVAIVTEPTELPIGLSWQPFIAEKFVVIVPASYEEEDAAIVLSQNPYISFERSKRAGEMISTKLKDLGIRVKSIIETDSIDSIWEMVACGMGVSVIPQHRATRHNSLIESKQVKVLPLCEMPFELVTGLVTRSNDPKAILVSVLYEALSKLVKDSQNTST